jgi:hypothetical protein
MVLLVQPRVSDVRGADAQAGRFLVPRSEGVVVVKQDIFALLQDGQLPDPAHASLPVLSLWQVTTYYLMFFTLVPDKFASHFDQDVKSYQCLGDGCPACDAGVRATEHIYLPVWDAQNRRVAVLKFDTRPEGPAQKVLSFLAAYKGQLADVVAVVDCKGRGEFAITAHQPLPETDRGALACAELCRGLQAGTVSLRACVKQLKSEEVAQLASVRRNTTPVVGDTVAPGAPPPAVAGDPVVPRPEGEVS